MKESLIRKMSNRRRRRSKNSNRSHRERKTEYKASDQAAPGPPRKPVPELPPLIVELHGVLDAIAANAAGLTRQWGERFDSAEYYAAMESDRNAISSFLVQITRAMKLQDGAATVAGVPNVIPQLPVPLADISQWASSAPEDQLWRYQTIAVIGALQSYMYALEQLGKPARLEWKQGRVTTQEFEPMRVAVLQQQGRLLAEVVEESVSTLANLVDDPRLDLGVAPESDGQYQQLVRSYRLAHNLGSPEASLLHLVRFLSSEKSGVDKEYSPLIANAKSELLRYAAGKPSSRGVILMLADALARAVDESRENSTSGSSSAELSPTTEDDDAGE